MLGQRIVVEMKYNSDYAASGPEFWRAGREQSVKLRDS